MGDEILVRPHYRGCSSPLPPGTGPEVSIHGRAGRTSPPRPRTCAAPGRSATPEELGLPEGIMWDTDDIGPGRCAP